MISVEILTNKIFRLYWELNMRPPDLCHSNRSPLVHADDSFLYIILPQNAYLRQFAGVMLLSRGREQMKSK